MEGKHEENLQKDFKYFDKQVELVSCDTKRLVAVLFLEENRLVYHVIQAGNNVISLFDKFDKALKEYNELP